METIEILETLEISKEGGTSQPPYTTSPSRSRFDKNVFRLFIALIFIFPLFFIPLAGISLELEKALLLTGMVSLIALVWILARLKSGLYTIPKTVILFAAFLIVVAFFISGIFSGAASSSLFGVAFEAGTAISLLSLFLVLFLSSIIFQSDYRVMLFFKTLLASFGVLFIYHLVRIVFGADILSFGLFLNEGATPIGRWNDFGILGGLVALFSMISLEFGTLSRVSRRILYGALIAGLCVLVAADFSLLWTIVGIFALSISVYNFTVKRDEVGEIVFSSPSLLVLIISIIFIIGGASLGSFVSNFTSTGSLEVRPSWTATYNTMTHVWSENPLVGTGPNRFSSAWLLSKPEEINRTPFWNTDFSQGVGTIPSYAVTTGLLGVLAVLFFLSTYLYHGLRFIFKEGSFVDHHLLALFVGSLYLWLIMIFDTPSFTIAFLAFITSGVFLALSAHRGHIKNLNLTHRRDPRIGFASVLILIVLLVGVVDVEYKTIQKAVSLYHFNTAARANEAGEREAIVENLLRAVSLNENDRFYRALSTTYITELQAIVNDTQRSDEEIRRAFQETLGNAIRVSQEAVAYDSTNYLNHLALFEVYGNIVNFNVIEGAYESALQSLKEAQERNPKSPALVLREAELELASGNIAAGREALERALLMKEDYTDAIFLLAEVEIQSGNTRAAIKSLEEATLLEPNNVSLFFSLGLLYFNNGDYVDAIQVLERVRFLSPQYSNAKYYLGLAYYERGRVEDAVKEFKEVEELNPGNELVRSILENLAAGKAPLANISESSPTEPPLNEE